VNQSIRQFDKRRNYTNNHAEHRAGEEEKREARGGGERGREEAHHGNERRGELGRRRRLGHGAGRLRGLCGVVGAEGVGETALLHHSMSALVEVGVGVLAWEGREEGGWQFWRERRRRGHGWRRKTRLEPAWRVRASVPARGRARGRRGVQGGPRELGRDAWGTRRPPGKGAAGPRDGAGPQAGRGKGGGRSRTGRRAGWIGEGARVGFSFSLSIFFFLFEYTSSF
jgi:hypothetical protein